MRCSKVIAYAALALAAGAPPAHADPVSVVNALRVEGCGAEAAARSAVRRDAVLDAAARELARTRKLPDALARVGYPVGTSTSFHVRGSSEDAAIRGMLEARYCAAIADPKLSEIGAYQSGDQTWIVMAGRAAAPFVALRDPAEVAQRVLELVNTARSKARRCGRERLDAVPPLVLSTPLMAAASVHSLDMAERGVLSHDGSDGSTSGERVTRAGYVWLASGENVAAGQPDAESVVEAWLESPGHCATLMNPHFTESGIAFALAPGKNPAIYWTQVFGAPR